MAAENLTDIKEFTREYNVPKESNDLYKKLVRAYTAKERKEDNVIHHAGKKLVLNGLEKLADEVEGLEHEDHLYKLLGKVLHNYENAKIEAYNKKHPDKKLSKLDYSHEKYTPEAEQLINALARNDQSFSAEALIQNIKEGNIDDVVTKILGVTHNNYVTKKAKLKMRDLLPPNKSHDFYKGIASARASRHQEDYTDTDLAQIAANRDSLVEYLMEDYKIAMANDVKKMKPAKKPGAK